jgi:NADH-quinone oxidoreductase subunit J
MQHLLLMQIDSDERSLPAFLAEYWPMLLPVVLGAAGVYLLLPRARWKASLWGVVLGGAALASGCVLLLHASGNWPETLLFYIFALLALLAGGMMIAQSNPVHAALSFALVVLSTCGLFLLQAGPFLMAATIIIYAGAIVVTFLFVIMLAQQEGYSTADLFSREPFLGTLAGFVLMGAAFYSVQRALATPQLDRLIAQFEVLARARDLDEVHRVIGTPPPDRGEPGMRTLSLVEATDRYIDIGDPGAEHVTGIENAWNKGSLDGIKEHAEAVVARLEVVRQNHGSLTATHIPRGQTRIPGHPALAPGKLPHRNVEGLGRLLFTTYLVPVELAGVLLLVASIGAIVIAGRRGEVLR